MNLFININNADYWLEQNLVKNNTNYFWYKQKNVSLNDLLIQKVNENNLSITEISSINIVISLEFYKDINFLETNKFIEFNRKWNIRLISEIQPIITFCRENKKILNFVYIYHNIGPQNIMNIAMIQLLKTLVIGLSSETQSFDFSVKLIIVNRNEKKKLQNLEKKIFSKRKKIIADLNLIHPLKFSKIKRVFSI